MKKKAVFTLLLCSLLAAYTQAYSAEYDQNGRLTILKADLNRDGYFNIVDISLVASAWLQQDCGLDNPCNGADVFPDGGDGSVDLADFAAIAEVFGKCTDPTNPDCIHVPLTLYEPPSVGKVGSIPGSYIGIHEVGHSFLSFVDEYVEGGFENMSITQFGPLGLLPSLTGADLDALAPRPEEGDWDDSDGLPTWTRIGISSNHGAKPLLQGGEGGGSGYEQVLTPAWVSSNEENVDFYVPGGGEDPVFIGKMHEILPILLLRMFVIVESGRLFQGWLLPQQSARAQGRILGAFSRQEMNPLKLGAFTYLPVPDVTSISPEDGLYLPEGGLGSTPGGIASIGSSIGNFGPNAINSWGSDSTGTTGAGGRGSVRNHLFSGEVCVSAVDLHIPSFGSDVVWQRKYRSRLGPNTVQGNGWDHSYNIYLEQFSGNLILHDGTRKDFYYPSDPNTWVADGFFRELVRESDGSFTLTFAHKGKWTFNPFDGENSEGKMNAITDRNGNTMTLGYDAHGRLTTIHDTRDTASHDRDITI
jgi:YD repeat-containing protein